MSNETTNTPNGESGKKRTEAKVTYVNKELINEYLKKHNIDMNVIVAEFSDKEVTHEGNAGGNNDSNNSSSSSAGKHTKVVNSGLLELKLLLEYGYLKVAAREQTPKIKALRVKRAKIKTEPDELENENENPEK